MYWTDRGPVAMPRPNWTRRIRVRLRAFGALSATSNLFAGAEPPHKRNQSVARGKPPLVPICSSAIDSSFFTDVRGMVPSIATQPCDEVVVPKGLSEPNPPSIAIEYLGILPTSVSRRAVVKPALLHEGLESVPSR